MDVKLGLYNKSFETLRLLIDGKPYTYVRVNPYSYKMIQLYIKHNNAKALFAYLKNFTAA